ncbi:uncharacterized protein CANTADRAFT_7206 [Suhomyces tanzawaensis NRRL Y-17324]|uniref:Damage-regulated import facilitator 1 n=1 Tax=Suhomyces tanzawaensis NRRL Y-17324 TaxID=984487 RepID=A0A1E4SDZ4_9ASCO|nr:uncharacterized protein CANTADRAFT_7206 [Suhomyces tanzawaensis NRRL Y-17324]ODV77703.1 hypothetical protein CANTADRAFT_7206 [Suhomyces tanzawaensis NRRL Y-17324]
MTMSQPNTKRQMNRGVQPQHVDPEISALSTIGMRIRKAVAEGYSLPNHEQYSYSNGPSQFQRVPLPANMSQPPSLTNMGSTVESSGSRLGEWDSRFDIHNAPVQTLPNFEVSHKRKHAETDDGFGGAVPDLGTFRLKYGDLSFNEEV